VPANCSGLLPCPSLPGWRALTVKSRGGFDRGRVRSFNFHEVGILADIGDQGKSASSMARASIRSSGVGGGTEGAGTMGESAPAGGGDVPWFGTRSS
jgi:hypothetical protein